MMENRSDQETGIDHPRQCEAAAAGAQLAETTQLAETAPLAHADAGAADCRIQGTVKWFDAIKGYGFVTVDDGLGDILIHYKLLALHRRKSLPDGTAITLLVRDGPRGRQGTEILDIDCSTATMAPAIAPSRPATAPCANPAATPGAAPPDGFETVQVRWFNRTKGYGFLLRSDGTTEVFIHMETVRRGGFATLLAGQQLLATIEDGPRGAHAVAIHAQAAARS